MFEIDSAGESDYDNIAISGISEAFPRSRGRIQLARTGPFVPPFCVTSNNLIATTAMLERLERSHFDEWSVLPVIKYRIARSTWMGVGSPPRTSGDPEDFIMNSSHDEECAKKMSDLWEIVPPIKGFAASIGDRGDLTVKLVDARVIGGDLFRIQLPGGHVTACSESFRGWLQSMDDVRIWLKFITIETANPPKQFVDQDGPDIVDDFLKHFYDRDGMSDKGS